MLIGGGCAGRALAVAAVRGWSPLAYVVLLSAYSVWLKHVVIVDVLVVALGFVLRAVAGGGGHRRGRSPAGC